MIPIAECVGSTPINAVEAPITSRVAKNERLARPNRSPGRPRRTAPTGRTTNPVPNAAMLSSGARLCSPEERRTWESARSRPSTAIGYYWLVTEPSDPDAVIAATGYRAGLEPGVGHLNVFDRRGMPLVSGARTFPRIAGPPLCWGSP
jgi:hypothetical protein